MALFNKLFSNRRGTHNKHQDNVSEKLFAFSKDQVRIVLFRECDFRGRKLLFDSNSVKKVPVSYAKNGEIIKTTDTEKISEISNGYGYVYTKPESDFNQLAEMVFGSVAMSFRGTYFKMHTLDSPNRLMFSQVFSSPRLTNHGRISVSSRSEPLSFEHSKLDDSGASSTNSMSEHLSVHSTASDTVLVCRRPHSTPLDVPVYNSVSVSIPSLIGDSGYGAGHSYSNVTHGSLSTWGSISGDIGTSSMSLSCSSLYKKWLRRTSTSLENSGNSLANSGSTQDNDHRHHHRSSKLGLAFILQLTSGLEEELNQFLMEHISLLDVMLWRARHVVEVAYVKSQNFASLMVEMANLSTQYLVNLLSGSHLSMNLWLSLSSGCDNYNSISAFSASFSDKTIPEFTSELWDSQQTDFNSSCSLSSSCSSDLKETQNSGEFNLFSFTKFLKTDPFHIKKNLFGENRNMTEEKFIQDFCELLENVDVKDTNFFMSTLLTAVLTYHLGWVSTCLPTETTNILQPRHPFNPLWGKLSDLYGAVGQPVKIAQTLITGTNKRDLISKILVSMTYFIRCCDIDKRVPVRADMKEENQAVDAICRKYSCIPKENYKKYEDHLKEIMNSNKEFFAKVNNTGNNTVELSLKKSKPLVKKSLGLAKTQTYLGDLTNLGELNTSESLYPKIPEEAEYEKFLYPKLDNVETSSESNLTSESKALFLSTEEITKKVNTLCRVPSSTVLCYMDSPKDYSKTDQKNHSCIVNMEKQMRSIDCIEVPKAPNTEEKNRNVVFVLGENEQLVGIKKDDKMTEKTACNTDVKTRPTFLNIPKPLIYQMNKDDTLDFRDSDFTENSEKSLIKPSTSWSSVGMKEVEEKQKTGESRSRISYSKKYSRAQSEPPEEHKVEDPKNKSKYRYSGVKFNLQQYPQILSNYMKSKNVEISNLHFGDKGLKMDDLSSLSDTIISKYPELDEDYEEGEALQTPSNASELEFTSDLFDVPSTTRQTKESNGDSSSNINAGDKPIPNETADETSDNSSTNITKTERKSSNTYSPYKMKVTNLPMPKSKFQKPVVSPIPYTSSLMRAASDTYMPNMVLQGPILPKQAWESKLKSDLALASQHSPIDQPVEEAVAVIANIDTWEVQLMSSHTFLIDKGSTGIRIGMSQMVSNMLESLVQMWKLKVPPHFCLMHIEQTLQELCVRSKALAELLLATEFCNMEQLTSALQLEVNDVPLLLAVASTHSPQVTQKYGLSFQ